MARLDNHGSAFWLRDDAAAAFNRMERERGFIDLNSAGRYEWEQQQLIDRWNRGGAANRPPYLYQPAMPASSSNHVRGGGIAFDTSDWRRVKEFAHLYGFKWYGNSDPVHFDYVGGGSSGGSVDQVTKDRQNWLNASRGAGLEVDGIEGPATKAAYKAYQSFLGVEADGIWGPATQAAHQRYYDSVNAPAAGGTAQPKDMLGWNWNGIAAFLRATGNYAGNNQPGPQMIRGLQNWLNRNGYDAGGADGELGPNTVRAVQRWLNKTGRNAGAVDGLPGGQTHSAWDRAENENWNAFPNNRG